MGKIQYKVSEGKMDGDRMVFTMTMRVPLDHIAVMPDGSGKPIPEQAANLLVNEHGWRVLDLGKALKLS